MRIASLSPAATEILFALGKQEWIVCADQFSNFPEEAKRVPHVRDHQKIRAEDLLVHNPELTLTATVIQERLAGELRKQGLGVVHQDPRTLRDIEESIRQIGILVGAEEQAAKLCTLMRDGLHDVKRKAALLGSKPRVYIEEWHAPPMASGNWVPEIVRIAGGRPFPIADGELSREVTLNEVRSFDPDLIVISWCGAGSLAEKNLLLGRPHWHELRAVSTGNVRVIDDSLLNRPGPRLVEGAQRIFGWLFELMH
jgi:iron complex transport system substrate-binding protein